MEERQAEWRREVEASRIAVEQQARAQAEAQAEAEKAGRDWTNWERITARRRKLSFLRVN